MAQEISPAEAVKDDTVAAKDHRPPQRVFKLATSNELSMSLARNVVISNTAELEDEFKDFYVTALDNSSGKKMCLQPPYDLKLLRRLSQENNALQPCIEAMVTNIDGTGYDFLGDDLQPEDQDADPEYNELWDFFREVWPGEGLTTVRKSVRRDIEQTGNGYIEIISNANDDLVFMRYADSTLTRLVQLDAPVVATKTLTRKGVEVAQRVSVRERRFAQISGPNSVVYFKEFGASRDLNKKTGEWAKKGERLPYHLRASEIIHFKALPAVASAYGVPRWIGQLPSVLGSRKAEEYNLEFFDNGGVPPVLLILQGGTLAAETRNAIDSQALGSPASKNRIQVIEAEPTGGSLDSPGTARVTVERFGAEKQNDSMFENYDAKCEARIRRSFRIPPIFVGMAEGFSFATAYTSYTVTEAQVFKPERDTFDEVMDIKIIPRFKLKRRFRMRSLPISITDAALVLKGVQLAWSTGHVEAKDVITQLNETTGTAIKPSEKPLFQPKGTTQTLPDSTVNPDTGLPYQQNQPTETQRDK